jgi:hypothetical protein
MPTNEDIRISMAAQDVAAALDDVLERIAGKRLGFVLLTFSLDVEHHRPTYVSNCDREQMKWAMRRLLDLWDEGMPDIPAHEVKG